MTQAARSLVPLDVGKTGVVVGGTAIAATSAAVISTLVQDVFQQPIGAHPAQL